MVNNKSNLSQLSTNDIEAEMQRLANEVAARKQIEANSSQGVGSSQQASAEAAGSQGSQGNHAGGNTIERGPEISPSNQIYTQMPAVRDDTVGTFGNHLMSPLPSSGVLIQSLLEAPEEIESQVVQTVGPRAKRPKIPQEIQNTIIMQRGTGISNKKLANIYNISESAASTVFRNHLRTGLAKKQNKKRDYKKHGDWFEATSLLLFWLQHEPLLSMKEAWRRLARYAIIVTHTTAIKWMARDIASTAIVHPEGYCPAPHGPTPNIPGDLKTRLLAKITDPDCEVIFISMFKVHGIFRGALSADTPPVGTKRTRNGGCFFGAIFGAFTANGVLDYQFTQDAANGYSFKSHMAAFTNFLSKKTGKFYVAISNSSEESTVLARLMSDANIECSIFPPLQSRIHLGDVIFFNMAHLIYSLKPKSISEHKKIVANNLAVTPKFVQARFQNISAVLNGGSIDKSSEQFFPANGDVMRPVHKPINKAEYDEIAQDFKNMGNTPMPGSGDSLVMQPGCPTQETTSETEVPMIPVIGVTGSSVLGTGHPACPSDYNIANIHPSAINYNGVQSPSLIGSANHSTNESHLDLDAQQQELIDAINEDGF